MLLTVAVLAGLGAIAVGLSLLRTWIRRGGTTGATHFRRVQIMGHAAIGLLGVVLLIVHLLTPRNATHPWLPLLVLLGASILGATMFLPWWWRGRRGLYGDHDPAGFHPAEDHFKMRTVKIHGALADLSWILLLIGILVS